MLKVYEVALITLSFLVSVPIIFLWLLSLGILFLLSKALKSQLLWKYAFNLAYSLDQIGNSLLLGDPDETISSRCGRALKSGKAKWFVKPLALLIDALALIFGDKNHIAKSVEHEQHIDKEIWSWIKS